MPLVNGLERRLAPGAAFQHPLSLVGATLEEQSGEVVKPSDTRAVGVRAHLRIHVRGEIQHVCEDGQVRVAHRAPERNVEHHLAAAVVRIDVREGRWGNARVAGREGTRVGTWSLRERLVLGGAIALITTEPPSFSQSYCE